MAVNVSIAPWPIVAFAGVMVIPVKIALTVNEALLLFTLPRVAEIVAVPSDIPVTCPDELIVATPVSEEFQLTLAVISAVLLSE
jgi:hypothetical protein